MRWRGWAAHCVCIVYWRDRSGLPSRHCNFNRLEPNCQCFTQGPVKSQTVPKASSLGFIFEYIGVVSHPVRAAYDCIRALLT
jgi:hypothetical protein